MVNRTKKEKPQLFLVHGGMTFKNRKDYLSFLKNRELSLEKKARWTGDYLNEKLGSKFQIIKPRFPLQDNAKYEEWKIVFESYIPLLRDGVIFIGSSLGGIFLAKYFSENKFPKKVLSLYLVCPPFDNTLVSEDLVGGFKLKSNLSLLDNSAENLYLLFSQDDPVIPVSHAKKYQNKLEKAVVKIYKGKNGHFLISSFPEIVRMIEDDRDNLKRKGE